MSKIIDQVQIGEEVFSVFHKGFNNIRVGKITSFNFRQEFINGEEMTFESITMFCTDAPGYYGATFDVPIDFCFKTRDDAFDYLKEYTKKMRNLKNN